MSEARTYGPRSTINVFLPRSTASCATTAPPAPDPITTTSAHSVFIGLTTRFANCSLAVSRALRHGNEAHGRLGARIAVDTHVRDQPNVGADPEQVPAADESLMDELD